MLFQKLFLGLICLTSCATFKADLKQYAGIFGACMESKGISAAPQLAADVFNILDSGHGDVTSQLESLFAAAGTELAKEAFSCAVSAWLGVHPVQPNAKPTKSQAAARIMEAKLASIKR